MGRGEIQALELVLVSLELAELRRWPAVLANEFHYHNVMLSKYNINVFSETKHLEDYLQEDREGAANARGLKTLKVPNLFLRPQLDCLLTITYVQEHNSKKRSHHPAGRLTEDTEVQLTTKAPLASDVALTVAELDLGGLVDLHSELSILSGP